MTVKQQDRSNDLEPVGMMRFLPWKHCQSLTTRWCFLATFLFTIYHVITVHVASCVFNGNMMFNDSGCLKWYKTHLPGMIPSVPSSTKSWKRSRTKPRMAASSAGPWRAGPTWWQRLLPLLPRSNKHQPALWQLLSLQMMKCTILRSWWPCLKLLFRILRVITRILSWPTHWKLTMSNM